jgi:hypothetical protein
LGISVFRLYCRECWQKLSCLKLLRAKSPSGCYNVFMLNELAKKRFGKLSLAQWLLVGSALLLVGSGLIWWFAVQTQPRKVFDEMIEQSLSTNGVTIQAQQEGQASDVDYWLQLSLGSTNQARSLTRVTQGDSKVTTEVLGTLENDYTRYVSIETTQTDENGQPINTEDIQNVWAKSNSSLLAESALGLNLPLGALPVPIGNLQSEERAELLQHIKDNNVYRVDYDNVETKRQDGRLQYVYNVEVQVILYANLLKQFAKSVGLNNLDTLDPNSYSGTAPLELKMTVDVRSRHLVAVDVAVSETQSYSYTYGSYDIPLRNELPEQTITDVELQQRVQGL